VAKAKTGFYFYLGKLFTAMHQLFAPHSFEKNNSLLLRVTAFCWLMAKLIGWRMFTTYRSFPTAPAFGFFDQIHASVHTFLYVLAVLLLILLLLAPVNKLFVASLLVCDTLSCLLDQNRLQPWDYQYMFLLFVFMINDTKGNKITGLFLFILASTYIYSGLGKLNAGFLHTVWTKMLLEQFLHLSPKIALQSWAQYCGYAAGLFELIAGFGLLFTITRKISAGMLILLHLFILVFLGPFGLKYNLVVWPWNVAMMVYLYVVVFRIKEGTTPLPQLFSNWNIAVFICWGILPAFSFVGWWDNYLSSRIYTGKLPEMVICITDTSKCKPLQRYCVNGYRGLCAGSGYVNLQYWSMAETKMAPYPEIRSYKKIEAKLEKKFPEAGFSFIYFNGDKWEGNK